MFYVWNISFPYNILKRENIYTCINDNVSGRTEIATAWPILQFADSPLHLTLWAEERIASKIPLSRRRKRLSFLNCIYTCTEHKTGTFYRRGGGCPLFSTQPSYSFPLNLTTFCFYIHIYMNHTIMRGLHVVSNKIHVNDHTIQELWLIFGDKLSDALSRAVLRVFPGIEGPWNARPSPPEFLKRSA